MFTCIFFFPIRVALQHCVWFFPTSFVISQSLDQLMRCMPCCLASVPQMVPLYHGFVVPHAGGPMVVIVPHPCWLVFGWVLWLPSLAHAPNLPGPGNTAAPPCNTAVAIAPNCVVHNHPGGAAAQRLFGGCITVGPTMAATTQHHGCAVHPPVLG